MARFTRWSRWGLLGFSVLLTLVNGGLLLQQGEAATTIVVTSLADPGVDGCDVTECTLREALAAAQAGDILMFAPTLFVNGPATILLSQGELLVNKELTIQGPGRALLWIDGNQASWVFHIDRSGIATLKGLTIQGGQGGIFNEGTLTLGRSLVRNHLARGIANAGRTLSLPGATATIMDSTISNNAGGGISNGGMLTVISSIVRHNSYVQGGGIYNGGTITLITSTIRDNSTRSAVQGFGGGIYNGGTMTLLASTVRNNSAQEGGGLFNLGDSVIYRSTISSNMARGSGGGIANYRFPSTSLGTITLTRSTVSGNAAQNSGGGLSYNGEVILWMRESIVAGNTVTSAPSQADCDIANTRSIVSRGHNLVSAGTGCPHISDRGDITVDPVAVFTKVLGPLQDNGGPTFTHALLPGSPALDTASPARCQGTDQRGVVRPQGTGCDIGAFELEVP